jgi:hypothetical protein
MDRHKVLSLAAITSFGVAVSDGNAIAQQKSLKEQLVGAWMVVHCEVVRPDGTKGRKFGRRSGTVQTCQVSSRTTG